MDEGSEQQAIIVHAPLFEFACQSALTKIDFPNGITLAEDWPTVGGLVNSEFAKEDLSKEERDKAPAWLIRFRKPDALRKSEVINAFLTSLWLAQPSKVNVHYYFWEGANESGTRRFLDRFNYPDNYPCEPVEERALEQAKVFLPNVLRIIEARGRLLNALALTARGFYSVFWQASVLCFSSAAEGLLVSDEEWSGITKRRAKAFACITKTSKEERDEAYEHFSKLYAIRSDIVHGRIIPSGNKDKNVEIWIEWSELLRSLWRTVLSDERLLKTLDEPDSARKELFLDIERDFKPSKASTARPS